MAYLMQQERAAGTVNVAELGAILFESKELLERKQYVVSLVEKDPTTNDADHAYRNHSESYEQGLKKACALIDLKRKHHITDSRESQWMDYSIGEALPFDVHGSMFIPTLAGQCTDAQKAKWLPLALSYQILGTYAQTELGHGSNVRGLETVATYDARTQEFILHSPTLTSRKWWPGGLGKTVNHAIVYASLVLQGECKGIHGFIVQLRRLDTHLPLPGICLGDIGPKVGFNSTDNGFCSFTHVRIPREQMLMKYAEVSPAGVFQRVLVRGGGKKMAPQIGYFTMVRIRAFLVKRSAFGLAHATTIAARYSVVRVQGTLDKNAGEVAVIRYQNQQAKLIEQIAVSYAAFFAGQVLIKDYLKVLALINTSDDDDAAPAETLQLNLAELHATSSGLKSITTYMAAEGIEACRRLCGGHGFLAASRLSHVFQEFVGACTYEGTFDVLAQQSARFLLKMFKNPTASTIQYLAQAPRLLVETCRVRSRSNMSTFPVLLRAYEARAVRLLAQASDALDKAFSRTHSLEVSRNECMVDLTRASVAHSQLVLVASFSQSLEQLRTTSAATKAALTDLALFFCLRLADVHMAEFRMNDYFSDRQATWVHELWLELLPVIRPNVISLTDAWHFSDFELKSALGRFDGEVYRALVASTEREPLNQQQVPRGFELYLKPLMQEGRRNVAKL